MVNDEQLARNYQQIIDLIANGTNIEAILTNIATSIATNYKEIKDAVILKVDPETNKVNSLFRSSFTNDKKQFVNNAVYATHKIPIAFHAAPRMSNNITDGMTKEIEPYLKKAGVGTSTAIPILSHNNETLAILSLACPKSFMANKEISRNLEGYVHLATIALELAHKNEQVNFLQEQVQEEKENCIDNVNTLEQLHLAFGQQQFELYYQPYYDCNNVEVGLEALIRWNHPEKGVLPPASFLPVAESTNFIIRLEEWVLHQGIKEVKQVQNVYKKPFTLSVNISAKQLEDETFPLRVAQTLKRYAFQPELLTLEITERFLIEENKIDILKELKKIGVRLSIDDFGTAYSSLHYLKSMPIDELKIDRGFIAEIETNENDRKIVEMIIKLGHELNVTIVAEGVETNEQFHLLKKMNCDRYQGFLFSKPEPLSRVKAQLGK